ncbi:probable serine/threonine-protein kinase kinX, partial [Vespula pensylvanica]|uniref:probable serine/threonine-protein kinase kinX n=1 Tax=Vespula pensylvanica TaxID=30213 RepID=UPI001CBA211E
MEEQQIVEITETPLKKVIKKKKTRITEAGVPEEVVEEIVIEKPKEEQAKPILEELERAKEEKPEVIEVTETPTTKLIKRKKKPTKKGEATVIIEEIIQKTGDEAKIMEEQQIVEITETPLKKVIKKKKTRITEAGVPQEVVEEIVIEKSKEEQAKPIMEELARAEEEKPEVIEVTETPTTKIIKRKKKPTKKGEATVITQEIIQKTRDEAKIMEEQQIVEITETPLKKVIKKKKTRITETGVPEEVVEEIVIEKPKEEQAKPIMEELARAKEEKPEVIEVTETPTTKIIKRRKKPTKKGEATVITEEIIQKTGDEAKIMEEQQIVEIIETPLKKVIKKKKTRITEAGAPEEVVEEIVIEKPKEEQAKPILEELATAKEEKPEVIEVTETPTTKIIKRKKKPTKKGEATVITEEIIQKTGDEAKVMEEQQIVEITETPLKKVIKKKKTRITEAGVPEEVLEEIVIEKPKEEHAKPILEELKRAKEEKPEVIEVTETPT